ncbi:MAG: alanine--tRNA ligase [Thermodesulfobacteriota bacterium]|nr:alanine--tRNA ligase [Thermodesulfobacteriota bacterium]
MTGSEIRQRFLEYFENKGHTIVKSSSLIPKQDPTLLFSNAGMVQFKRVFLGEEKKEYKRAATSQKCVRAGGKHNDLENVGITARHHTFFEMLGNFSFGDYFKREAIEMSWEFLVEKLGLPKEKMWITVYTDDDDAFDIWRESIGAPEEKIIRMGEEDNFWTMGETGPCGPCSEILIDQGSEVGCKRSACKVGCDCDRFLELWNLVFMQFDRSSDGVLTPLPKPSIDTGMGLERIAAVVQGVKSNYDCDIIRAVIQSVEEISERKYNDNEKDDVSLRVVADHSRAITFLIGDGVLPSNEGRGYVLRRIVRRAARHGKMLGLKQPFLYRISGSVIDLMKEAYPELADGRNYIANVVHNEEERFLQTLSKGLAILNEEMEQLRESKERRIPGHLLFKLYDTYGFPVDLASDIVKDEGFTIDEDGFQNAMEKQRNRARESWKGSGEEDVSEAYTKLVKKKIISSFSGYEIDNFRMSSSVLVIMKDGEEVLSAEKGDHVEIITEKTPFYGESGGQVGDTGSISGDSFSMEVEDTTRPLPDLIVHTGRILKGTVKKGDEVTLHLQGNRRENVALNHTATHLLHAALKEILGDHVKQAGSLVAPERLRFDFTHFSQMTKRELQRVEELVNQKIRENIEVETQVLPIEEALETGATALFGEKYSDEVRVVELPGYSKELCGGTHVRRTGDIGLFKIISEYGIATGVRRIDAITGEEALKYVNKRNEELQEIGAILKAKQDEIVNKAEKLLKHNKDLEKEVESLKEKIAGKKTGDLLDKVKDIEGINVLSTRINVDSPKALRIYADKLRDRLKSGIMLLAGEKDGSVLLIVIVSKDLIHKFNANDIIKQVASLVGGSGGGRPDMAQAGGGRAENLEAALESIYEIVRNTVTNTHP